MDKCLIDNTECDSVESLHKYLRRLGVKQEEYYTKYYPRNDLYSGEPIKFKNRESYLSSFFLNRDNMKKWLKERPVTEAYPIIKEMFLARKKLKNLIFAPSEVELRSAILPSRTYFEYSRICYEAFCEDAGLINKLYIPTSFSKLFIPKDLTILIDTREQKPIDFGYRTKVQKLDEGDYGVEGSLNKEIYIERKSLPDFCGTLSSGYDRFTREIERTVSKKKYLVVLIEYPFDEALRFNQVFQYTKASPEFIFSRVGELMQKFSNIQFLFVDSRKEAARIIPLIFSLGETVKTMDLQFLYNKDIL